MSETVTSEGSQTQTVEPRRERRLLDFWRRFRRNKLAVFGLFIVTVMILTAIFAPVIAPSDPKAQDYALTLRPPGEGGSWGPTHWAATSSPAWSTGRGSRSSRP